MAPNTGKILVLRFSSMGDVVLSTAVFRCLRRLYPRARLAAGVKKEYASLLACHPCVDEVLALDSQAEHKGPGGLLGYARLVRRRRFDLVVDLHGNLRSRLFCLFSGAPVLRPSKAWLSRRLLVWFKARPGGPLRHAAARYLDCLSTRLPPGFKPESPRPDLRPSQADAAWADAFLRRQGLKKSDSLIGVNPGAAWPTKRWPPSKFAEVLDHLARSRGRRFLFVGARKDLFSCEETASRMRQGASRCIQSAGRTSPGQLAALIARCRLLITNDSGPMHVAVGSRVPVVALFGPTVRDFGFWPLGPRDQVVEKKLSCRPCTLHGSERCPILTHECMEGIAGSTVIKTVNKVLGSL